MKWRNRRRYFADLILYCLVGAGYDTGEAEELNDRLFWMFDWGVNCGYVAFDYHCASSGREW